MAASAQIHPKDGMVPGFKLPKSCPGSLTRKGGVLLRWLHWQETVRSTVFLRLGPTATGCRMLDTVPDVCWKA